MLRNPADFGTAEEAKAMLEKAVAAVKENKAKALDMFNKGESGFKDRDLYVYCANASDGIFTAHPTLKGNQLRDIKGKHGAPLGETIMENATEGTIKETTYWWRALAQTSHYRRPPSTRRPAIRFAQSATTRSEGLVLILVPHRRPNPNVAVHLLGRLSKGAGGSKESHSV